MGAEAKRQRALQHDARPSRELPFSLALPHLATQRVDEFAAALDVVPVGIDDPPVQDEPRVLLPESVRQAIKGFAPP